MFDETVSNSACHGTVRQTHKYSHFSDADTFHLYVSLEFIMAHGASKNIYRQLHCTSLYNCQLQNTTHNHTSKYKQTLKDVIATAT